MDGWDFRFSNQRTKSTPRSEKLEITFWLDVTYKKKKTKTCWLMLWTHKHCEQYPLEKEFTNHHR
jgi:hypothetical protein